MDEVDLLVIGSGSGLDVAGTAANLGQTVGVVEKGPLGGTCLNRGCIPSKMLLYHAHVMEQVQRASEFGIEVEVTDVAFEEIVTSVNEEVSGDAEGIRRGVEASDQHRLYRGEGRFVDEKTVEIHGGAADGARVRGATVLIAAGSRPAIPPIDGIEDVDYLTSTEALQVTTPPEHLLVVGGGYVGAELGHFFETFGSDVTVVGRRPHLLPDYDDEIAHAFTELLGDRLDLLVGYEATAVSQSGGEITVEAQPYDGTDASTTEVTGDELLVAAGRRANTDVLNVEAAGVETDDRGFVETDPFLRTTADDVWALGDVTGEYMLKHAANHEARTAMLNILGDSLQPVDYTAMPAAVFSSPEVATVGETEQEVRERGADYQTTRYEYTQTARGDAMHADGFVKVVTDPDGEILGCHILGPQASVLIQEVVVAMKAGSGTVGDIRHAVHIHPALTEVVSRAFSSEFVPGPTESHQPHDVRELATDDAGE